MRQIGVKHAYEDAARICYHAAVPDKELDAELLARLGRQPLRSMFGEREHKKLSVTWRGRRAALRLLLKRIAELGVTTADPGALPVVSRFEVVQRRAPDRGSFGVVLISRPDFAQQPAPGNHTPDEEEFVAGASKAVKTAVRRLHSRGIPTTHLVDGRLVEDAPNGVRRDLADRG